MKRRTALALIIAIFAALFGCTAEQSVEVSVKPSVEPSAEVSVEVSTEPSTEPIIEPSPTPFPTDENGTPLYRKVEGEEGPAPMMVQYSRMPTLEDCLSGKYVIKATFVRDVGIIGKPNSGVFEMEFKVDKALNGSIDEDTIYTSMNLYRWKDGEYTIYNYVEGHQYLLIASKSDSVYNEHTYYRISEDDFLPITDDGLGAYVWGHNLSTDDSGFVDRNKMPALMAGRSYIEYIEKLCENSPWDTDDLYIPYTDSTDMYEIADECDFIIAVTPGHMRESTWNYIVSGECEVNRVIKNTSTRRFLYTGDEIYLTFFDGSVVEGEQYIVMINKLGGADGGEGIYHLAAKTAVYPYDEETIAALKEYLAEE